MNELVGCVNPEVAAVLKAGLELFEQLSHGQIVYAFWVVREQSLRSSRVGILAFSKPTR
ncbi:hypothetical protein D3C73_1608480 [compost metagenome]